jgi:hypothetical protein
VKIYIDSKIKTLNINKEEFKILIIKKKIYGVNQGIYPVQHQGINRQSHIEWERKGQRPLWKIKRTDN